MSGEITIYNLPDLIKKLFQTSLLLPITEEELDIMVEKTRSIFLKQTSNVSSHGLEKDDYIHVIWTSILEVNEKYDDSYDTTVCNYFSFIFWRRMIDKVRSLSTKNHKVFNLCQHSLRGQNLLTGQDYFTNDAEKKSFENFTNSHGQEKMISEMKEYVIKNGTEREIKILKLLFLGYRSAEIALKLKISKKTVDRCKNSYKDKFKTLFDIET